MPRIVLLPGDGIGPEIMAPAVQALEHLVPGIETESHLFGGHAIDEYGVPLTDETLEAAKRSHGVLLGAVGGPKWDTTDPDAPRPEQGLLGIRKALGLYANLRPVRPLPALYDASPLRREIIEGTDMLVVRELTGGIYFGQKTRTKTTASDLCEYSEEEIARIARVAFRAAKRRVTSVDKANVLETSRLWREVVGTVHAEEFGDIELEHQLVDSCAMKLVADPRHFDVIVTENMFGDILSDEAAMLTGSIGMLPSASVGAKVGLFEPIHGSAPDIAGKNIANPIATIASAAMMLSYAFQLDKEAEAIDRAIVKTLDLGYRTKDIQSPGARIVGTAEMGDAILRNLT